MRLSTWESERSPEPEPVTRTDCDDDDDATAPDDDAGTMPCVVTRGRVLGTTTGKKPSLRFFILTAPGARPRSKGYTTRASERDTPSDTFNVPRLPSPAPALAPTKSAVSQSHIIKNLEPASGRVEHSSITDSRLTSYFPAGVSAPTTATSPVVVQMSRHVALSLYFARLHAFASSTTRKHTSAHANV